MRLCGRLGHIWPSPLRHLEQHEAAATALKGLLRVKADLTIGLIKSGYYSKIVGPDFLDDYLDGLRNAGLPE